MNEHIVGINRTALWTAWKGIRKQLRDSSRRDVVDFLEYDIEPKVWIQRLLDQLERGIYEPSAPQRFELAKAKGFSRRLTFPEIPDLVLYRAVVDYLFSRVRRREYKHVYFEQDTLAEATKRATSEAIVVMQDLAPYASLSTRRIHAWLRYDQYRRYLILRDIFPFIVITDITNFFDSVPSGRIRLAE
jgi:hypothetical protein